MMKKILCNIGQHDWNYQREEHEVEGLPSYITKMEIPVRECKSCGKRQHHMMPKRNGEYLMWRDFSAKEGEKLKFRKI